MRLPADKHWSLGTCVRSLSNRSYEVEVCGKRYRRNRRHLRATNESPPPPSVGLEHGGAQDEASQTANIEQNTSSSGEELISQEQNNEQIESSSTHNAMPNGSNLEPEEISARRSTRVRRPPVWHKDYLKH
mgnify:FL=1